MSITTRLVALLTLVALSVLGLGAALDYRLSRAEILNRLEVESEKTIDAVLTDLENLLDGVEGATLFLGRILEQRDYSEEGLRQILRDLVEMNSDVFGAAIALNPDRVPGPGGYAPYVYRRDGLPREADLGSDNAAYTRAAWYYETVAAGKPLWLEPYFDREGGQVLMTTFAVPVYRVNDAGGRVLYAVATADIALVELQEYLQRLELGELGHSILLSRAGTILSAHDPDDIMRHYSEALPSREAADTWDRMFAAALSGETRATEFPCPDSRGDCTFRLGALETTGWPVGVVYSQWELLAPLRAYQFKTLSAGLLTVMVMALAVTLVTRRLTRPLSALAEASDDIARGELNAPLPRARGEDEVARLVRSFRAMTGDLKTYISDLESVTASRSRLEGELAAAREIQMAMLPGTGRARESGEGFNLWATVRPAKSVGGDLYSYERHAGRLRFAVGDVSDKGVPAALFMARAISHLQQLDPDQPPGAAVAALNDALEAGNDNCMFVTLFFGELDLAAGLLRFASAGHPAPLLLRGEQVAPVEQVSGPALGLAPGQRFPDNTLQLQPGDRLAVYSDGIEEAFNLEGEMFGEQRLGESLSELGARPLAELGARIIGEVDQFAGEAPQSDDITLLLLELPTGDDGARSLRQDFPAREGWVAEAMAWLASASDRLGLDASAGAELVLVGEELITNIAKYAGLQAGDEVRVGVDSDGASISLTVADPGRPFNPFSQARRAALGGDSESAEVGGLGVHLVTQLTDEQHYRHSDGRNRVRVRLTPGP